MRPGLDVTAHEVPFCRLIRVCSGHVLCTELMAIVTHVFFASLQSLSLIAELRSEIEAAQRKATEGQESANGQVRRAGSLAGCSILQGLLRYDFSSKVLCYVDFASGNGDSRLVSHSSQ